MRPNSGILRPSGYCATPRGSLWIDATDWRKSSPAHRYRRRFKIFCHLTSSFVVATRTVMPVEPEVDAVPAGASLWEGFAPQRLALVVHLIAPKDRQARKGFGEACRAIEDVGCDPRTPERHVARREPNQRLECSSWYSSISPGSNHWLSASSNWALNAASGSAPGMSDGASCSSVVLTRSPAHPVALSA